MKLSFLLTISAISAVSCRMLVTSDEEHPNDNRRAPPSTLLRLVATSQLDSRGYNAQVGTGRQLHAHGGKGMNRSGKSRQLQGIGPDEAGMNNASGPIASGTERRLHAHKKGKASSNKGRQLHAHNGSGKMGKATSERHLHAHGGGKQGGKGYGRHLLEMERAEFGDRYFARLALSTTADSLSMPAVGNAVSSHDSSKGKRSGMYRQVTVHHGKSKAESSMKESSRGADGDYGFGKAKGSSSMKMGRHLHAHGGSTMSGKASNMRRLQITF